MVSNDNIELSALNYAQQKYKRYFIVRDNSINKYALYDMKKKTLSEFKYDRISADIRSETPIVTLDGKKYKLQPVKHVLLLIPSYVLDAASLTLATAICVIVILPVFVVENVEAWFQD